MVNLMMFDPRPLLGTLYVPQAMGTIEAGQLQRANKKWV